MVRYTSDRRVDYSFSIDSLTGGTGNPDLPGICVFYQCPTYGTDVILCSSPYFNLIIRFFLVILPFLEIETDRSQWFVVIFVLHRLVAWSHVRTYPDSLSECFELLVGFI
jgi:hypothetical protein